MAKKRIKRNRPKKQFCVHGHDTFVVGRFKDSMCKLCSKINHKKHYEKNKKRIKKVNKKWKQKHKKQIKKQSRKNYLFNKQKIKERTAKYHKEHPEIYKRAKKRYRILHPIKYKLSKLKQHKQRGLRARVKFGQRGLVKFFSNCPKNKVVDHIIPLQGELVSGLNVIWNLQYLTPRQNGIKNNKCNLMQISEDYGKLLEKLGLKDKKSKRRKK